MYFNGMFDLGQWNPQAQYTIFDDWEDWDKLYNYKQWLGAQKEFTIVDKYRKKRTIQWGKSCILLSNNKPYFKDMTWIKINCFEIEIINKLY